MLKSSALGLVLALLFNMVAMIPLEAIAESFAGTGADGGGTVVAILLYAVSSVALVGAGEVKGRHFAG
jgi:hypothetical protein